MNKDKEKLLKETYNRFIKTSLEDLPLDEIDEFIDKNIMGYGSCGCSFTHPKLKSQNISKANPNPNFLQ